MSLVLNNTLPRASSFYSTEELHGFLFIVVIRFISVPPRSRLFGQPFGVVMNGELGRANEIRRVESIDLLLVGRLRSIDDGDVLEIEHTMLPQMVQPAVDQRRQRFAYDTQRENHAVVELVRRRRNEERRTRLKRRPKIGH